MLPFLNFYGHRNDNRSNLNVETETPGAAGSRPTGHRAEGANATHHLEALPSSLSKKFKGSVMGTIVVDGKMPDFDASVTELVTPIASPLLDPRTMEYLENCQAQLVGHTTGPARGNRIIKTPHSPTRKLPYSQSRREQSGPNSSQGSENGLNAGLRRGIVKHGGFLVFTDEYLGLHPLSPIASMTQEFELVNPRGEGVTTIDPSLDERKRHLEMIRSCIRDAEAEHRPLFRLRNSDSIYGRAQYISTAHAESAVMKVYEATSILSTVNSSEDVRNNDSFKNGFAL